MEWFQSLFNGESGSGVQLVVLTTLMVIGLILVVWLFRKIVGTPARRAARNRVPRLSITDVTAVDDKRFLVLVRRDNVEHLVLIGGPTDVVVETGIMRTQTSQPASTKTPEPRKEVSEQQATSSGGTAQIATTVGVAAAGVAATVAASADETPPSPPEPESQAPEPKPSEPAAILAEEKIVELEETAAVEEKIINLDALNEASPEPIAETEDLEATLSESLEDTLSEDLTSALSEADLSVEATPPTAPEPGSDLKGESDDEMRKLLEELAGETAKTS
jgi:hypothetical protein